MNPASTTAIKARNPALDKLLFIGKIFFIGFLILIMNLPMGMIQSLIFERNERRDSADWDVIKTWGRDQTLEGPVLTVPYVIYTKVEKNRVTVSTAYAHFLPENLKITGTMDPEIRYRGIFKIPLYRVNLAVQGSFNHPDFGPWHVPEKDIQWNDAFLSVGIPDMRAIQEVVKISWNGESREFDPGAAGKGVFESGIQVPVRGMKEGNAAQNYSFAFDLKLAGSKTLNFLPLGKATEVSLHSTWNNPSFIGAYLPSHREVSDQGFSAGWKVLHLGRNYPQQWLDAEVKADTIKESAFGVSLLFPVETYQMTTRSAKYAILFILLTFVTFFFFEIFNKIRIHAVSYLLVGFAMCLFYLLLLSLSEHLDFGLSYLAAAAATVLLVTSYSMAVLKAGGRAVVMGGVLAGLYGYLYILLQLQDYALLMGAVGFFVILALIMFITRKVNWYGLTSSSAPIEKAVAME